MREQNLAKMRGCHKYINGNLQRLVTFMNLNATIENQKLDAMENILKSGFTSLRNSRLSNYRFVHNMKITVLLSNNADVLRRFFKRKSTYSFSNSSNPTMRVNQPKSRGEGGREVPSSGAGEWAPAQHKHITDQQICHGNSGFPKQARITKAQTCHVQGSRGPCVFLHRHPRGNAMQLRFCR